MSAKLPAGALSYASPTDLPVASALVGERLAVFVGPVPHRRAPATVLTQANAASSGYLGQGRVETGRPPKAVRVAARLVESVMLSAEAASDRRTRRRVLAYGEDPPASAGYDPTASRCAPLIALYGSAKDGSDDQLTGADRSGALPHALDQQPFSGVCRDLSG